MDSLEPQFPPEDWDLWWDKFLSDAENRRLVRDAADNRDKKPKLRMYSDDPAIIAARRKAGEREDERLRRMNSGLQFVVLITGSRDWRDGKTIADAIKESGATKVIEGGAAGADRIARHCAQQMGLASVCYPARWEEYGKAAGPIRNQKMLDDGKPDMVLAFPLPQSIGTHDMIRRAKAAGVEVRIFYPDPAVHPPTKTYDNGYFPNTLEKPVPPVEEPKVLSADELRDERKQGDT